MDKICNNVYLAAACIFLLQDAQNRVAAYALCQLFPDLPIQLVVTEPYSSLSFRWKEGDGLDNYVVFRNAKELCYNLSCLCKCYYGIFFNVVLYPLPFYWFSLFVLLAKKSLFVLMFSINTT